MNIVIDLETTIRCPVGNNSGNAMWRGNKVIATGVGSDDGILIEYNKEGVDLSAIRKACDEASLVIGHNVKFDLLYIYRDTNNALPTIWDTQLAAYLLSGQRHLYASLDELTAEYVGEHALKDDKIKAYWKSGMDTNEIPERELREYLFNDVANTEDIFKQQWKEADELEILPLILTQMDALRSTIEMNRNGMRVDWDYVLEQRNHYENKLEIAKAIVSHYAPSLDLSLIHI